MEIFRIFSIEAARSLPNLPDKHPCKNIHGHSFKIIITIEGDIDKKTGFVMDFNDIDIAFKPIFKMTFYIKVTKITIIISMRFPLTPL